MGHRGQDQRIAVTRMDLLAKRDVFDDRSPKRNIIIRMSQNFTVLVMMQVGTFHIASIVNFCGGEYRSIRSRAKNLHLLAILAALCWRLAKTGKRGEQPPVVDSRQLQDACDRIGELMYGAGPRYVTLECDYRPADGMLLEDGRNDASIYSFGK